MLARGRMGLLRSALPRALLGEASTASDACALRGAGVIRVVHFGQELPTDCGLPVTVAAPADASCDGLEIAAQRLLEVLAETLEPSKPRFDTFPGDSSDEEGGSNQGVRMRVRVKREPEGKWGIKWHKDIFKKSQRLVVDEITEGSIMDQWNACQPPTLQVRYGDRLARINGVSADGPDPSSISARMRAELQQDSMRALFWRPGCGPVAAMEASKEAAGPGIVLLCADEGIAAAAAVSVAARVVAGDIDLPIATSEGVLDGLGEEAASALRSLPGTPWLAALQALAAAKSPLGPKVSKLHVTATDCDATEAPKEQAPDERSKPEAFEEAAAKREPEWTYSCRKCGVALFHDLHVVPHGGGRRVRHWGEGDQDGAGQCTSVWVEPMGWMGDLASETGRLACGNTRCRQKLGAFSWHGLPCSCGEWQCPAFQIHGAKVDCMPARRVMRGPPPAPVFDA